MLFIRVIPKKANVYYINFGDKFDLQIEIVAIFRKKRFLKIFKMADLEKIKF